MTNALVNQESRSERNEVGVGRPEEKLRAIGAPVDVYENKDEYLVFADMPGAKKENLSISYSEGQLRFGARVDGYKGGPILHRRALTVGWEIDPERISAELKNGVLQVHLPKSEAAKPREIPVRAG